MQGINIEKLITHQECHDRGCLQRLVYTYGKTFQLGYCNISVSVMSAVDYPINPLHILSPSTLLATLSTLKLVRVVEYFECTKKKWENLVTVLNYFHCMVCGTTSAKS